MITALIIILVYLGGCLTSWLALVNNYSTQYQRGYEQGLIDAKDQKCQEYRQLD